MQSRGRAVRHDLGDSFSKLTPEGPVAGNKVPADDHSMDFRRQMELLGMELGVPFIDMTQSTRELYVKYGPAKTSQIISDGQGGTHLSEAGAAMIARQCDGGAEHSCRPINVSDAGISLSPADASDAERVYVRWYPDWNSALIGTETDYDGLAITDIYVLAEPMSVNDDTAPVLTASIPADGATGASVNGSVVLTFDEKVVPGNGDATLGGTVLKPIVSGKSIVYPYTALAYNTTYTSELPEGAVTDRSGNKAAAVRLSFTTMSREALAHFCYERQL